MGGHLEVSGQFARRDRLSHKVLLRHGLHRKMPIDGGIIEFTGNKLW